MISVSVIIPTMNRLKDLRITLSSIAEQSRIPNEVIVVDQSDDDCTKKFINDLASASNVLRYVHLDTKSLTKARNLGLERATGEVLLFLDDDVTLDKCYIERIIETFEGNPTTMLVSGWVKNSRKCRLIPNVIRLILGFDYQSKSIRVRPNFSKTSLKQKPKKIVPEQWASGCNFAVRRDIARKTRFDEQLVKYALAEDVDFSFRVFKEFGHCFMQPSAELIHRVTPEARFSSRKKLFMQGAHSAYLFRKNIEQTPFSKFFWYWNWFWRFIFCLGMFLINREQTRDCLAAIAFLIEHRHSFFDGDLTELHEFLER